MKPLASLRLTITNINEVETSLIDSWKKYYHDAQTSDTEIVLKPISTIQGLSDAGKIITEDVINNIHAKIKDAVLNEIIDGGYSGDLVSTTKIEGNDITVGLMSLVDNTSISILKITQERLYETSIEKEINDLIELIKSKNYITSVEEMLSTKLK